MKLFAWAAEDGRGGQVGRPASRVLVFDLHGRCRLGRRGTMATPTRLDTRLTTRRASFAYVIKGELFAVRAERGGRGGGGREGWNAY